MALLGTITPVNSSVTIVPGVGTVVTFDITFTTPVVLIGSNITFTPDVPAGWSATLDPNPDLPITGIISNGSAYQASYTITATGTDTSTSGAFVLGLNYVEAGLQTSDTFAVTTESATIGIGAPPVPVLDAGSDSGVLGDGVTSTHTPMITGTATANAAIKLYDTDGTTLLGTATADVNGLWSVTNATLSEGTHTVRVTQTDATNTVSSLSAGLLLTIDAIAPAAPSAPVIALASDSGTSHTDGLTSVTTPVFTGTAEASSTVRIYDGATLLGTGVANSVTGIYEITSMVLAEGAHTVTAKATDAAGNVSTALPGTGIVIDTAGPATLALSSTSVSTVAATNGAAIATLSATDVNSITYGFVSGNGVIDADNTKFSISGNQLLAAQNLNAGTYHIYLSATDAAGNQGFQIFTISVVSGPSVSSIARAGAASATVPGADNSVVYSVTFSELVSGVDTGDFSVHGSGASGTAASVTDTGDGIHYLVTVNGISGDGTLRLDLNASGTGIQNAANAPITGGYTSGQTYTIDRTAPALPSAPLMTAGTDTGASSSDAITSNPSPAFTGTGEIGSTVTLYDASNSNAVIGSATVDGTGHYSITPSAPLTAGAHQLYAQASDAAANTSAHTANLAVAIDTAAPTAILLPNATVLTNAGLNAVVGTLGATDAGGSGALSYQLVAGVGDTGNAAFTLTNGVLTINDPNAAGVAVESIRVRVTDAAGNSYTQVLEVHVSAPPDPTPPTVDGVPVTTAPVTLPGGGSGTAVTIPVVTAGQGTTDGAANVADIPLVTNNANTILLAQVPVGTGLTATGGASQPAGSSLAQLIGAIKAQTSTHDAADQGHLTGNGAQFLNLLASDVPLLVNTIVVSNVDAAASTPLTLTGTSSATQHTALVIDTSQLPGNSDIVLNHVDFAAVVGKTTIAGNTNGQVITGDAASQHVIVSAGTASQVYAGGGSDVLQYGQPATALAANHLEGGAPQAAVAAIVPNSSTAGSLTAATAILLNGGTGADTASFAKAQSAYTIDQRDGYVLITDNSDATQRVTVTNVETLQFKDGSVAVQSRDALSTIAGLYENVLGRQADIGGFDFWGAAQAKGASLGAIAVGMLNSAEAVSRGYGLNGDATHDINTLYQAVFGRAADAGGLAFWKDALAHGYTMVDVANGFASSAEMVGHKLAATGWDLAF